jgi:hypothetical protein
VFIWLLQVMLPFCTHPQHLLWMYIRMLFPCSWFEFIGWMFEANSIPAVNSNQYAR